MEYIFLIIVASIMFLMIYIMKQFVDKVAAETNLFTEGLRKEFWWEVKEDTNHQTRRLSLVGLFTGREFELLIQGRGAFLILRSDKIPKQKIFVVSYPEVAPDITQQRDALVKKLNYDDIRDSEFIKKDFENHMYDLLKVELDMSKNITSHSKRTASS